MRELAAKSADRAASVFLVHNGQPQMSTNHEGPSRDRCFANEALHLLRSINITPNFPGVVNFVALILVDTKATAFELAPLR